MDYLAPSMNHFRRRVFSVRVQAIVAGRRATLRASMSSPNPRMCATVDGPVNVHFTIVPLFEPHHHGDRLINAPTI